MIQKVRGAIAAGHPKTAEAGKIMFELGGNAFDAAIAAMLASFVVESTLTSAAGGGFLLAHTADRQNILFDFFCQTPRQKKPLNKLDFYPVEVNFGGAVQVFHIGLGSIATPGSLAGAFEIQQKLGRLPFDLVAEPAISYARQGYTVTSFNAFAFKLLDPILTALSESQKIYAPTGKLLQTGQIKYMTDFANTLTEISQNGIQLFYRGEIAHQLINDLSDGGCLTLEDLNHYKVIARKPLKIHYRDYELLTNPPPSSGGILIAFALKLLENIALQSVSCGSNQHLQILAQVMSLTNQARKESYDSHFYKTEVIEQFLCQNTLRNYQNYLQTSINKWGSTTHISVIDSEGNAASVTNSNGEGSSYVIPGTGIMLNNMLGEADLNPLGFHQWQCDRRISSMMSPTIVLKEGKPMIVLGSGGSNRIRTAILQVISNLLDFNLPLEVAVKSPRVHWEDCTFSIEPISQSESLEDLMLPDSTQVVLWQELNMFFGGVHAVRWQENGEMEGTGDPRRSGVAIVY